MKRFLIIIGMKAYLTNCEDSQTANAIASSMEFDNKQISVNEIDEIFVDTPMPYDVLGQQRKDLAKCFQLN